MPTDGPPVSNRSGQPSKGHTFSTSFASSPTTSPFGATCSYASLMSASGRTVSSLHLELMAICSRDSTSSPSSTRRGREGSRVSLRTRLEAPRLLEAARLTFLSVVRDLEDAFLTGFSERGRGFLLGDTGCDFVLKAVFLFLQVACSVMTRDPDDGSTFSLSGAYTRSGPEGGGRAIVVAEVPEQSSAGRASGSSRKTAKVRILAIRMMSLGMR